MNVVATARRKARNSKRNRLCGAIYWHRLHELALLLKHSLTEQRQTKLRSIYRNSQSESFEVQMQR